jgi:hypothetical protein
MQYYNDDEEIILPDVIDKSAVRVKGIHTFSFCEPKGELGHNLVQDIEKIAPMREQLLLRQALGEDVKLLLSALNDTYYHLVSMLHNKFKTRELVVENITTTAGRTVLTQRLGGLTTNTGIINYTALGTDNTAPAIGDTQLGTETYRKALSTGTNSANVAILETFFTQTEVSGTFEEYGMFIDGTGTANSGVLFNRFTQTQAKSNIETLNVHSEITLSDA